MKFEEVLFSIFALSCCLVVIVLGVVGVYIAIDLLKGGGK